jgi:hypothetical protein
VFTQVLSAGLRHRRSVVVALILAPGAASQTAGGGSAGSIGCNNQARTADIVAGWHNVLSGPCTSITITAGPVTVQTPMQCPMGGAYYNGTVYKCGPASTGNNCFADGFKVNFTTYGTGGASNCPPPPTTTSFESWEAAAGLISQWINCPAMPVVDTSYDWSAKVRKRPGVQESIAPSPQTVTTPDDAYVIWYADPASSLSGPANDPFRPLGPGPEVDPASVPALVRDVLAAQAGPPAARINAEFQLDFHDAAGQVTLSNVYTLSGTVARDGRFSLESALPGLAPSGETVPIRSVHSFDGASFATGTADGECINVYASTSVQRDRMLQLAAPFAELLVAWISDPSLLPALSFAHYQIGTDPETGDFVATRAHVSYGSLLATTSHHIDATGAAPVVSSVSITTPSGALIRTRALSNHEAVGSSWKPALIVETWFDLTTGQPRFTSTLRISRAAPLTASEADALSPSAPIGNVWLVRT